MESPPLPLTVEPVLPAPNCHEDLRDLGGPTRLDTAICVEKMGGALLAQAEYLQKCLQEADNAGCLRGERVPGGQGLEGAFCLGGWG